MRTFSTLCSLLLAFAAASVANACELNGKTILAWIDFCGTHLGRPHQCIRMQTKTVFIGDKALYYDSTSESTGTIFYFGRTADAKNDPNQRKEWPKDRGVFNRVLTRATSEQDNVKLEFVFRVFATDSGRWLSDFGYTQGFRVSPACERCAISNYDTFGHDGNLVTDDMHLTRQTCEINWDVSQK